MQSSPSSPSSLPSAGGALSQPSPSPPTGKGWGITLDGSGLDISLGGKGAGKGPSLDVEVVPSVNHSAALENACAYDWHSEVEAPTVEVDVDV